MAAQNTGLRHCEKRQSSKRKWSDAAFLILVSHVRFHFPNSVGSLWSPGAPYWAPALGKIKPGGFAPLPYSDAVDVEMA